LFVVAVPFRKIKKIVVSSRVPIFGATHAIVLELFVYNFRDGPKTQTQTQTFGSNRYFSSNIKVISFNFIRRRNVFCLNFFARPCINKPKTL